MNVVNRSKSVVVRFMIISMFGWLVTACEKPSGLLFPPSQPPGFEIVNHNSEWKPIMQEFGGVQMALVPAGCFQLGSTDEQIDYAVTRLGAQRFWMDKEKPVNQQCFDKPFWIDLTEVTNAQFNTFGGQASRTSKWTAGNRPREMIGWDEALAFCEKRGARLPTEAEWEYAARGPDNLLFPWGNEFDRANVVWADAVGDPLNQTAEVGSKPSGASWVGALDLSGNVWEWVSSLYKPYPYNINDGREDQNNTTIQRVIRGGSWDGRVTEASNLRGAERFSYGLSSQHSDIGFRCALSYGP